MNLETSQDQRSLLETAFHRNIVSTRNYGKLFYLYTLMEQRYHVIISFHFKSRVL